MSELALGRLQAINLYGPYNMAVRVEQRRLKYTAPSSADHDPRQAQARPEAAPTDLGTPLG